MPQSLPAGPYKTVETGAGPAPWYVIPFDKDGRCTGPLTRDALVDSVATGGFTDLFLFSHGWNNDWAAASARYEDFIAHYIRMRADDGLAYSRPHKPVLVGIFWPSTALVLPWERAPKFAAIPDDLGAPGDQDDDVAARLREIEELAADVDPDARDAFYALAQAPTLDDEQARRLADLLASAAAKHARADDDLGAPPGAAPEVPDGARLLERARQLRSPAAARRQPGTFGFATGVAAPEPQAAFGIGDFDPRGLIRLATVRQMKDRAGVVGATGVAALLGELAAADAKVRIHLVGHSYGGIVVLSALCAAPATRQPLVDSVLLLQPAVSQWCFAADVAGRGFAGGYRPALTRTRGPIFTTFTRKDGPLTTFFHLALTRERDLGQPHAAADDLLANDLPSPPSRYAALGGYGPAGLSDAELQVLDAVPPPARYALRADPRPRVCALRGDAVIGGHGDVSVPATWWALFQQVEPGAA